MENYSSAIVPHSLQNQNSMELKLHSSMASLRPVPRKLNTVISSHSKFPHFSPPKPSDCSLPSTPLCSYAVPDSKNPTTNSNKVQPRRKNATPTGRFAQKTQTSRKENLPREPKPKLDNTHNRVDQNRQNALFDATTLNVNLIELCEEGKLAEALELMGQGSVADYGVFLAMLNLCEGTRSLEYGKMVHEFLRRSRFRGEVELNNRLIGMYEKCGNMNIARKVFDRMPERNMSSWHLMIIGYTENGAGDDALLVFQEMKEAGIRPESETFALVLAACAREEAVEEGLLHFESIKEYGIVHTIEHYMEVINILGNAGQLNEAEEFIERFEWPEEELALWFLGLAEVRRGEEEEKGARRCGLSPEVVVKGGGCGGAEVMVMEVMVMVKKMKMMMVNGWLRLGGGFGSAT
ncbi:hypothetical protein Ahy_B02g057656 [Arachis hypogaea]|uniref:Pentatricopeptide repeat-containing protein n=1 Tax=Arachis hypogaea TaxID=3818 RepID=A0A445ACH8_ARAHY|nr:hypothetical protein Ahy_B02g057656 [Arachis hypogaea]